MFRRIFRCYQIKVDINKHRILIYLTTKIKEKKKLLAQSFLAYKINKKIKIKIFFSITFQEAQTQNH